MKCQESELVSEGGREEKYETLSCCDILETQLEHLGRGSTWLAIVLGQALSLLMCVTAVTSVHLSDACGLQIPNAQNFAFYLSLSTVFTTWLACRPADRNLFPVLRSRGWKYAFIAFADAQANFLVVKAYQLTTLTSVQCIRSREKWKFKFKYGIMVLDGVVRMFEKARGEAKW